MSNVLIEASAAYIVGQANESLLHMRRKGQPVGVGPAIICNHGRGGTAFQYAAFADKTFAPGYFCHLLAREGFRIFAINDAGTLTWGDQSSTDRINDAVAYAQDPAKGGAKAGKVGFIGWSMGGMATLNWVDRTAAKHACSWLWAPASDMDYFHANATYTAEIDAAYPAGYAGDNPKATPENYRGVGPLHIVHAVDDATIPVQQSRDFVAAVNDPAVTLKEVPNGGHTALFADVTDLEMVQFFRDNLGAPTG